MTQTYRDLHPSFADPADWTLDTVLRWHAATRPEATFLKMPEEQREWTYSEILAAAERVAGAFDAAGAQPGDRVIVMAANSSEFVRTWFATGVGGTVEVCVNTDYEGEFLRHQVATVQARFAVIDDAFAERFCAVAEAAGGIEKFWVIDRGRGAEAIEALRRRGWDAEDWEALEKGPVAELHPPKPEDLGAIFFTSGTTGPSKGVAMPQSQLYFFAQIVVSLTRLTAEDTYLTTTPLFHGNAQFMAVYPALVAGGSAVVRSKFSASRWIDHVRESGVTVTNFVGVMMDFAFQQPARAEDADNQLRCIYAAPTASSIKDAFAERFGVEAFVDAFGLTETCAPILSPYGVERPAGAAGLQAADWFDIPGGPGDRSGSAHRAGRRTRRAPEAAVDVQPRLLQHAGEDRRGVAQPLVPHRRRVAQGRAGLVLLRRPVQGRPAAARREHQLPRDRTGRARPPRGARMRRHRCARGGGGR